MIILGCSVDDNMNTINKHIRILQQIHLCFVFLLFWLRQRVLFNVIVCWVYYFYCVFDFTTLPIK